MITLIKKSFISALVFGWTLVCIWISYAAFTSIPQESDGQPLTATKWNVLVDNVNNILKGDVVITASIPADQIRTNTCYGPTWTLTVTEEWLYFIRGTSDSYRYFWNYVEMRIVLEDSSWTIVFSTSSSIVSGTDRGYIRVDGSEIINLNIGTYTVKAIGSDASSCATSSINRIFSGGVTARLLR
jgi:hypothetical protein